MLPLSYIRFFSARAYKLLGIKPNCTLQEAKSAYYKQAQIYHPDKNSHRDAKEKFNSINQAYNQVVSDIEAGKTTTSFSQQTYTASETSYTNYQTEREHKSNASFRWRQYYRDPESFYEDKLHEFVKDYMAWETQQKQQRREQRQRSKRRKEQREAREEEKVKEKAAELNLHQTVELTNNEFRTGCTKQVSVKRKVPCECPQTRKSVCKICRGSGFKHVFFMDGFGFAQQLCECMKRKYNPRCVVCHGKGFRVKSTVQLIRIPKNSQPNQTLKVTGKGNRNEEMIGDLIITLIGKIKGDRIDFDFHSTQTISMAQAVLGTKIEVQTLAGKAEVTIPRGFTSGNVISLKGCGYLKDSKKNVFGDHYVRVNIKTPDAITSKEQHLYRELLELEKDREKQDC